MFFRRHTQLCIWINSVLVLFTVFCVNTSNAQQVGSGASATLKRLDTRTMDKTYKEI